MAKDPSPTVNGQVLGPNQLDVASIAEKSAGKPAISEDLCRFTALTTLIQTSV
jgi:hypothetical protein